MKIQKNKFNIIDIEKYGEIKRNYLKNRYHIVEIDFELIKDKFNLFKIFSNKLKFPSYFGNNWDAFWDCIRDLDWLETKNTIVLIKNVNKSNDRELYNTLIDTLNDAHNLWGKEKVKFDFIIFHSNVEKTRQKSILGKIREASK